MDRAAGSVHHKNRQQTLKERQRLLEATFDSISEARLERSAITTTNEHTRTSSINSTLRNYRDANRLQQHTYDSDNTVRLRIAL